MKKDNQKLMQAVWKKALGYTVSESVEEYSMLDGQLSITRQKITTKEVAPDISAVKLIFDMHEQSEIDDMTDEELAAEKIRLLKLLKDTAPKKKASKSAKKTNKENE